MWYSDVTPHSAIINWKLNCGDEPIVAGYNISYCHLNDSDECHGEIKSVVHILQEDEELYQFKLVDLKAYRIYRINIALMSRTRLGPPSFPLVIQTLECGKIIFRLGKHFLNDVSNFVQCSSNCST